MAAEQAIESSVSTTGESGSSSEGAAAGSGTGGETAMGGETSTETTTGGETSTGGETTTGGETSTETGGETGGEMTGGETGGITDGEAEAQTAEDFTGIQLVAHNEARAMHGADPLVFNADLAADALAYAKVLEAADNGLVHDPNNMD